MVVLVHGLGVDRRMWTPVLDALGPDILGKDIVTYDIRGHGEAADTTPKDMAELADDLLAVMGDYDDVVGLSMGGAITMAAAKQAPERFRSLALLGILDRLPVEAFEERARAAEEGGMAAVVESTLQRWFTVSDGDGVRYARRCLETMAPATWAATWRAYATLDVAGAVDDFPRPVLVLAGESDASIPVEAARAFAARIATSTFEVLPRTPHMQTLERPELVADALRRFLPLD